LKRNEKYSNYQTDRKEIIERGQKWEMWSMRIVVMYKKKHHTTITHYFTFMANRGLKENVTEKQN